MMHALTYARPGTDETITVNVEWPDNVSMVPPPEVEYTGDDGTLVTYVYVGPQS